MVIEKILASKDDIMAHLGDEKPLNDRSEEYLFPHVDDSCELTVACHPEQYSATRIAQAVEDCDAHLLNLNVTSRTLPTGEMTVEVRAGLRNADSAMRSLERYGYRVVSVKSDAADPLTDSFSSRISELLNIIEK